jgi:DNA-3-methyladenine glycosylase I
VARFTRKRMDKLMGDTSIIRNRLKIQSAVNNAKAFLQVQEEFGSFAAYQWRFVDGKPLQHTFHSMADLPAQTAISGAFSKDLKQRGFSFVGPTIVYAHMQAVGMVNDHVTGCFRHKEVRQLVGKLSG